MSYVHPPPPPLPSRSVTPQTIEDTYVSFILHCNPSVSPTTDTATLREAFRIPPRSDGKAFSTFHLFQLIQQLETKEIKTWVELALRLGVDPPDVAKGQSSQKIQQYAVRLKRWMHSMHVDAFFEYLLARDHPYWTQIPPLTNSATPASRDGVAPEDDMALRALLPHIRPRRGRKRADDEEHHISPSRRRADSPGSMGAQGEEEPGWAGDMGRGLGEDDRKGVWREPLSVHPQSAITPANRLMFWTDEPRLAVTPGSSSTINGKAKKRYGAKAVSSAWRSTSRGKTRGRPPANRELGTSIQIVEVGFGEDGSREGTRETETGGERADYNGVEGRQPQEESLGSQQAQQHHQQHVQYQQHLQQQQQQHEIQNQQEQYPYQFPRGPKPFITLQVPQRPSSSVSLVTPSAHPPQQQQPHQPSSENTLPALGSRPPSQFHPYQSQQSLAPGPSNLSAPSFTVNGEIVSVSGLSGAVHGNNAFNSQSSPAPSYSSHSTQPPSQPHQHQHHHHQQPPTSQPHHYSSPYSSPSTTPYMLPNFPTEAFPPVPTLANELEYPSLPTNPPPFHTNPTAPASLPFSQFPNPFRNPDDTTNLESLYNFLLLRSLAAEWIGPSGEPSYPADVAESRRIVDATFVDLHRKAKTKEAFLINVAVLAGGKILVHKRPRFQRLEITPEYTRYLLAWEYRLGSLTAAFTSKAVVYKDKAAAEAAADTAASRHFERRDAPPEEPEREVGEYWKKKYTELLRLTVKKDEMEEQVLNTLVEGTRECVTGRKTYPGGGEGEKREKIV